MCLMALVYWLRWFEKVTVLIVAKHTKEDDMPKM
jgi:hypothetical protein